MPSGVASSRFIVLIVPGMISCFVDRIQMMVSIAPAPPNKWPVIDLVALIATFESPNIFLMPFNSLISPRPVLVACAFIYSILSGESCASFNALLMPKAAPSPSGEVPVK